MKWQTNKHTFYCELLITFSLETCQTQHSVFGKCFKCITSQLYAIVKLNVLCRKIQKIMFVLDIADTNLDSDFKVPGHSRYEEKKAHSQQVFTPHKEK